MIQSKAITLDAKGIKIGDSYQTLLCASLFSFRIPRAHWAQRIQALKRSGYNCVDIYFPWDHYEQADGSFDFTGERNIQEFLSLLAKEGIWAIVRPGPYICSEWSGGAIPTRLLEAGIPLRCTDERFMGEVKKWYQAVLPQIIPYEYQNGGTVILCQLDNELDFFDCPDPKGYITALRDIALGCGVGVPLFVCAGQYNLELAGSDAEGVFKTLNCYPDGGDPSFDRELRGYSFRFMQEELPLFVSETHRDAFIHRRELACGSKLLGAYCQVAGLNFGFKQAVNNWGSPVSFLCTEYDFWSLIDVTGHYSDLFNQSRLLGGMLDCMGERIARALPDKQTVIPVKGDFTYPVGGMSVLNLWGGGKAVCVASFSGKDEDVTISCNGHEMSGVLEARSAPYYFFDVDLKGYGVPATLVRSNAELISANEKQLVFYCYKQPCIGLDFGAGEQILREDATINGVSVKFLGQQEAVDFLTSPEKVRKYSYHHYGDLPIYEGKTRPQPAKIAPQTKTYLTALGVNNGRAEYHVTIPAGKKLYIEHPCDIISYAYDGKHSPCTVADGRDILLPASENGEYLVTVQKWGHTNFDDPQAPMLRLSCKKGATSFGSVEKEEKLGRGDFQLLNEYMTPEIKLSEGYPVRLTVWSWNTTRQPVICAYTYPVQKTTDRVILKTTENTDVAVYVDGKLQGACAYATFELTEALKDGKEHKVTLVYRKIVWTQNVGDATILHVNTVPAGAEVLSEREFALFRANAGEKVSLPVTVNMGETKSLVLDISSVTQESILEVEGKNVLVTCVVGGNVIGRIIPSWEGGPPFVGGTQYKLYVSPTWNSENVALYVEALGEGACLTGIKHYA